MQVLVCRSVKIVYKFVFVTCTKELYIKDKFIDVILIYIANKTNFWGYYGIWGADNPGQCVNFLGFLTIQIEISAVTFEGGYAFFKLDTYIGHSKILNELKKMV